MENKNTISIKKSSIIALLFSLILGFCFVLGLNHLGKFTYIVDTSNIQNYDKFGRPSLEVSVPITNGVASVTYTSYFDSVIAINRPGYTLDDIRFDGIGKFHEYKNVSKYYINGTIKDYKYALGISFLIFIIYLFLAKFKIKLT